MRDTPRWAYEYIELLGLEMEPPSASFLENLCRRHLSTFAFENISKLMYVRDQAKNGYLVPPVEDFIQNYQRYHFGGTCFTANHSFRTLLDALGFDTFFVMLGHEHMGVVVTLPDGGGEKVYVDCGAAAPFFSPVRFESDPQNESSFGNDKVCIRPTETPGHYAYQRYVNGLPSGKEWRFDSNKRYKFTDFQPLISSANQPGTTVMTMLRCQLWQLDQGRSLSLANYTFSIRYPDGTSQVTQLQNTREIEEVIHDVFQLPLHPVRDALDVLRTLGVENFETA